ncbi:MAG: septum formation initiator family protein [Opitutae bacterium]|nr:septum formation initiator family protein [Opitutae bacterium]
MNFWKFIQRICLIASVLLLMLIVLRLFLPLIEQQKALRAREDEVRQDIQREAEQLRMLKMKQEKLQEDRRFIEKIAREDLGYAKPGETVFRFVDEEAP